MRWILTSPLLIAANKEIILLSDEARTTIHVATPTANQIIHPANRTETRDQRKDYEVLRQQDLVGLTERKGESGEVPRPPEGENCSRSAATSTKITGYPITQVRQEESRNQK